MNAEKIKAEFKNSYFVFFFLFFSFFCFAAKSQIYFPLPTTTAEWKIGRCWYFYPAGWYDEYTISMLNQDTIINSHTYKKLNIRTHHTPGYPYDTVYTNYLGAIREINKKVYIVSEYLCLDTIERCIYDFNPSTIGDTIYTELASNGTSGNIAHVISDIDSVLVGGQYHRRLELKDPFSGFVMEYWIDGIGSNMGLVYSSYYMLSDNSYDLACFASGDDKFQNPFASYGYCTSPLPIIICDSVSTSVPDFENKNTFIVSPNPVTFECYLTFNSEIVSVYDYCEITDVSGKLVLKSKLKVSEADKYQLNISSLGQGIYFITAVSSEGKSKPVKIVKL